MLMQAAIFELLENGDPLFLWNQISNSWRSIQTFSTQLILF